MLCLKMYRYHMEGKVLFIWKSLSLLNHRRTGLDWRWITSDQSAGTNAIIFLLVPSLSVHPNPVRHNETDPEGHSRGPIQNTLLELPSSMSPKAFYFFAVCERGHSSDKKWIKTESQRVTFSAQLVVDTEIISSTDAVHPPSCWILCSCYLFAPLGAASNGTM